MRDVTFALGEVSIVLARVQESCRTAERADRNAEEEMQSQNVSCEESRQPLDVQAKRME